MRPESTSATGEPAGLADELKKLGGVNRALAKYFDLLDEAADLLDALVENPPHVVLGPSVPDLIPRAAVERLCSIIVQVVGKSIDQAVNGGNPIPLQRLLEGFEVGRTVSGEDWLMRSFAELPTAGEC